MDPEYYKEKVSLVVALAPSIFLKHADEPIFTTLAKMKFFQDLVGEFGVLEIGGKPNRGDVSNLIKKEMPMLCSYNKLLCMNDKDS